jgi:hypothetical protein
MELGPDEFLNRANSARSLSDLFGAEDTTEKLQSFLSHYSELKVQDPGGYYWPTEKDPHAAEVIQWQESNLARLLPNVWEACAGN